MTAPTSPTDVSKTVTELNAGWYNVVNQALSLDPATFQLAQGTLGLQTSDSSGLFLMSDAVPPSAAVGYYDAAGMSRRSSAYALLLGALLPETGTDLRTVLGDQYANWIAFKNKFFETNPTSTQTQVEIFQIWANRTLDPRQVPTAMNTFKQADNAPLNEALDALHAKGVKQQFVSSAGTPYELYVYSATNAAATAAIQAGKSATIAFDSSSMDTTLTHTTVEGSASGFYDIFSGGASGTFDALNQKAAEADWSISGTIGQYATLLTQAGGWYSSAEVSRAYNAQNDYTVWDQAANAGDWDSFFDPATGSLAQRVSQLVLVSNYSLTVTSHASYSSADVQTITAEANFGIWPFFSASAKASHKQEVTQNASGELVVTYTLPKGMIEIWGVTVEPAPQ